MKQTELFENKEENGIKDSNSLYLLKLTNEVKYSENTHNGFYSIVSELENIYPGIDKWFKSKVIPGIKEGQRYAYLIMQGNKPIAETIIKNDEDTKLCSMRVVSEYQNQNLGPLLFSEIAKSLSPKSRTIHFTAPESLVLERGNLFKGLGFVNLGLSKKKYRSGEEEFVFKAYTNVFKEKISDLISEIMISNDYKKYNSNILISIKPRYAGMILRNKKRVEIRRKFSKKFEGANIFIYATSPNKSIVGEAKINKVVEDNPRNIWDLYSNDIGCTDHEFFNYCFNTNKISALVLEDVVPYNKPISWELFTAFFDAPKRPPQSFQNLKINSLYSIL